MYISKYFNTVYTQVKEVLVPKLKELLAKYPKYQYIFTGHSLGGAMSTIFSLDAVLDKYVYVKDGFSPVLLNYASPRVGNFVFAAYVMKYVPIIYRIVRTGDPVVSIPPCGGLLTAIMSVAVSTKCTNGLGLENFSDISKAFVSSIPVDKKYWHTAGMINYSNDMKKFIDCGKIWSENSTIDGCTLAPSMSVENHTNYLAQIVSGICQGASKYFFRKKVLKKLQKKNVKKQKKVLKKAAKKKALKKKNKKF
jgi:hypothetical protein